MTAQMKSRRAMVAITMDEGYKAQFVFENLDLLEGFWKERADQFLIRHRDRLTDLQRGCL